MTALDPVASRLLDRTGVCGARRGTLSQRETVTGRAFDRQIGSTNRGDRYADCRIRIKFAFNRHICYATGDRKWSSGESRLNRHVDRWVLDRDSRNHERPLQTSLRRSSRAFVFCHARAHGRIASVWWRTATRGAIPSGRQPLKRKGEGPGKNHAVATEKNRPALRSSAKAAEGLRAWLHTMGL